MTPDGRHQVLHAVRPDAAAAVLVLHGFTGGPASVMPLARTLSEHGHSVAVPLLPGHGTRWQDLNRTAYAQWLDAALAAYDELAGAHARVFVAGLSAGGALALEVSVRRSGVAGLVLINPAVELSARGLRLLGILKLLLPSVRAIGDDIARPGVSEYAYPRTPLRALHSLVRGLTLLRERLWRVTVPVLLFSSATDHVVPTASSDRVWRDIRSARKERVVLRRSLHVATLDYDADEIHRRTISFVESGRP